MKIIQIANVETILFALCEDGSLWSMSAFERRWHRCDDIQSMEEVRRNRQKMMLNALSLSNRTYRALSSAGVSSVHQLMNLSKKDLRAIPRLGAKSIYEIETALTEVGENLYNDGSV